MSSTNRGSDVAASEYYSTPEWCVHRLLEAVDLPGGAWLEPAVGDGAIIRAVASKRNDVGWLRRDIRMDADADEIGDFLTWDEGMHFDVAITNPPFSLAQKFAEKMLEISNTVILLVRLNWIAGPRAEFIRKNPCDIFVIPNRPSFAHGSTDSIEYCWLVWRTGYGCNWKMLADTPLEQRRVYASKTANRP